MYLALSISPHTVTGLFVESINSDPKPFTFTLPFNEFRSLSKSYWDEVISKALKICGVTLEKVKIGVTAEEVSYLSKSEIDLYSSTFEILPSIKQSVIYVGDYKGYGDKIVVPLIFDPKDFFKWFPQADNISEVENTFYNRQSYGILNTSDTWIAAFEHALFREKLSFLLQNISASYLASTQDIVLTGEGLLNSGGDKEVILSYLDSITTLGSWRLYSDSENILLNVEILKHLDKEIGQSVGNNLSLLDLAGCLVIPESTSVSIMFSDSSNIEIDLSPNSLSVIPLDKSDLVTVNYKLNGKVTPINASGGKYGLIIDNRKRPLLRDLSQSARAELIDKWRSEIDSKVDLVKLTNIARENKSILVDKAKHEA